MNEWMNELNPTYIYAYEFAIYDDDVWMIIVRRRSAIVDVQMMQKAGKPDHRREKAR